MRHTGFPGGVPEKARPVLLQRTEKLPSQEDSQREDQNIEAGDGSERLALVQGTSSLNFLLLINTTGREKLVETDTPVYKLQ